MVTPYFHIRDELSVQGGIIFRGERVVLPRSLRPEFMDQLHSSHLGINSCLRRARECLFWPGMSAEVRMKIETCEACREFDTKQCKEPLMPHEVPDRPWAKIGCDLVTCEGKEYLVTADYFSNYWEIDCLGTTKLVSKVCNKLKAHFARHGIPETVVSDNGPQSDSEEFADFSQKWDFEHTTSSPHHSRANGLAESAVKAVERLLEKNSKTGEDFYRGLLEVRNTPTQATNSSPVQRLYNRRTRTLLPVTAKALKPKLAQGTHEKIKKDRMRQAKYYDQSAKALPVLEEGDCVRMQPFKLGENKWKKGTIVKRLDDRSYQVQTKNGAVYRRNRVHLRHTKENPIELEPSYSLIDPIGNENSENVHVPSETKSCDSPPHNDESQKTGPKHLPKKSPEKPLRRSARHAKQPKYLEDFILLN